MKEARIKPSFVFSSYCDIGINLKWLISSKLASYRVEGSGLIIFETILGIIIAIAIPLTCILIAYGAFMRLYKNFHIPTKNSDSKLILELEALKKRVELLEKKLDNK